MRDAIFKMIAGGIRSYRNSDTGGTQSSRPAAAASR